VTVDALGEPTSPPALYRYAPRVGRVEPFAAMPAGGCIGCHVAISADGTRIAGGATPSATGPFVGAVFDTTTRSLLATSDTALPWSTAAFAPSGALITSYQLDGNLHVRDANTAAVLATIPLGGAASSPAVSPDGRLLAYASLPGPGNSFVGSALHVRTWDIATNTVGPVVELASTTGVVGPAFSPDGAWIAFSRTASLDSAASQGINVVRADGSAPPVELLTNIEDGIARFASPIAVTRAGGAAETMGWLSFSSSRAVGTVPLVGKQQQLWIAAFYPDRGVVARPFRLPGQDVAMSALHPPVAVPLP
jgi:dipeptidyl aminopeptidase/acylaminoacyl peptidase